MRSAIRTVAMNWLVPRVVRPDRMPRMACSSATRFWVAASSCWAAAPWLLGSLAVEGCRTGAPGGGGAPCVA